MPSKKTKKQKEIEPVIVEKPALNEPCIDPGYIDENGMHTSEEVFALMMTPSIPMNTERMMEAQAVITLRKLEIRKESGEEVSVNRAHMMVRDFVFNIVLKACMENGLRLVDVAIVMEQLYNESLSIPVWEYNNFKLANYLLGLEDDDDESTLPTPEEAAKIVDIFKSMGLKQSSNDCETEED